MQTFKKIWCTFNLVGINGNCMSDIDSCQSTRLPMDTNNFFANCDVDLCDCVNVYGIDSYESML